MAEAKKKSRALGKGTTPKGVLSFPHLTKPDTKFKAEGEYHTKVRLTGADAAAMIAKVDGFHEQAVAAIIEEKSAADPKNAAKIAKTMKRADKPYKEELDGDGNGTGAYLFTFKQKASIKLKDGTVIEKKVDLFDAGNKPFPANTPIYGGTVARVAYEALPFHTPAVGAGLTMRLNAVQVIELRTAGERSAEEYGFEGEEGAEAPAPGETPAPGGDKPEGDDEF